MDGIDFSLINSDGKKKIFSKYNITYHYPQELKNDIKQLIIYFNSKNVEKILGSQDYKVIEKKFEDFLKKKSIYLSKVLIFHTIRYKFLVFMVKLLFIDLKKRYQFN